MIRLGCARGKSRRFALLISLKNLGGRMTSVVTGRASRRRLARLCRYGFLGTLLFLALPSLTTETARAQAASPVPCSGGTPQNPTVVKAQGFVYPIDDKSRKGEIQPDLEVSGYCVVQASGQPNDNYYFGKVNVIDKGTLVFKEGANSALTKVTNFWARSIIVENGGALKAGVDTDKPYGTAGFTLNIILYGKDQSGGHPETNKAGGDNRVQTPGGEGNAKGPQASATGAV